MNVRMDPLNAKLRTRIPGCPYCGSAAHFSDGVQIGRSTPAWVCDGYPACDAYVGCAPGTQDPLGSLANAQLRRQRMGVHARIDRLWRPPTGTLSRKAAYQLVATVMRRKSFHAGAAREEDILAFDAAWPQISRAAEQLQQEVVSSAPASLSIEASRLPD